MRFVADRSPARKVKAATHRQPVRVSRATVPLTQRDIALALAIKNHDRWTGPGGGLTLWPADPGDMGTSVLVTRTGMRLARRPMIDRGGGGAGTLGLGAGGHKVTKLTAPPYREARGHRKDPDPARPLVRTRAQPPGMDRSIAERCHFERGLGEFRGATPDDEKRVVVWARPILCSPHYRPCPCYPAGPNRVLA